MMPVLSSNTQAILLLTAPLIAGRGTPSSDLLSPGEYKRLARHLREIQRQPSDLISPDAAEILRACQPVIDEGRLQKLLGRGFLLSQVIERWQARAIWVVSRADAEYPRRLKARLREDAPAVLYGCGDMNLLDSGGLAVVGSRYVDDALIDYTMAVGQLAAQAGRTVVSGGAKGIDQAAMRGALGAGGKVCGVLADSLEKTIMNRQQRNLLVDGQLVLISPYDPSAGFNVGNAMQRNKLIYALADTSLVVSSDLNKGGTWTGAVEQLDKLKFVPVYIRTTGDSSAGLDGLRKKGALPWPNPQDVHSLEEIFNEESPTFSTSLQLGFNLSNEKSMFENDKSVASELQKSSPILQGYEYEKSAQDSVIYSQQSIGFTFKKSSLTAPEVIEPITEAEEPSLKESTPAEVLFSVVHTVVLQLLNLPMKDTEVAVALNVSNKQAKEWLERLVAEGALEKQLKPVRYFVKHEELFK